MRGFPFRLLSEPSPGIIGVLASYLASTFISRQRRRKAKIVGDNEQGEDNDEDEGNDEDETTSNLEAKLAAMKEELAVLRKLFEERYQTQ